METKLFEFDVSKNKFPFIENPCASQAIPDEKNVLIDQKSINTTDSCSTELSSLKEVSEGDSTLKTIKRLISPFILSVEGIPLVDKQTFLNDCVLPVFEEFSMKTIFVQEPFASCTDTQELASTEPKRWLYTHQTAILRDKFTLYNTVCEHIRQGIGEVVALERSLFGDNIYARTDLELGNLTEIELSEFTKWQEVCNNFFSIKPHLIFYLKSKMTEVKFYESLEIMHSLSLKPTPYIKESNKDIVIKSDVEIPVTPSNLKGQPKIVVIRDMELFNKDENIKNKIMKEVRDAIITHEILHERI